MYEHNIQHIRSLSECRYDSKYLNIDELFDEAISLCKQNFHFIEESVNLFESGFNHCKLDDFFKYIEVRKHNVIDLKNILEHIKIRWLRGISMVCVYAPPELMGRASFVTSDNNATYPSVHAFTENRSNEDDDDTYMEEVYGSPDMFK